MSYQSFFSFSAGLSQNIKAPIGTIYKINDHVHWVETSLKIEREKYLDNPERWKWNKYESISDKNLCEVAETHNNWVRDLYGDFAEWYENPPEKYEEITNDDFQKFLPALSVITVEPKRWTGEYYTTRMETMYSVMRGRPEQRISFDSKPLTIKQAASVIILFSEFLDNDDRRLDVPRGHDELRSSSDGGYDWCEVCGCTTWDDSAYCKRRKCPLLAERKEYD